MQNMRVRPSWGISTDDLLPASTNDTFPTQGKLLPCRSCSQHSREQRISALPDPGASHHGCFERAEAGRAPHSRAFINLLNQPSWCWEYCFLKRFDWVKSWTEQFRELRHWSSLRAISVVPATHKQHSLAHAWVSDMQSSLSWAFYKRSCENGLWYFRYQKIQL